MSFISNLHSLFGTVWCRAFRVKQNGILVATLTSTCCHRVSARTCGPCVSMRWLGEKQVWYATLHPASEMKKIRPWDTLCIMRGHLATTHTNTFNGVLCRRWREVTLSTLLCYARSVLIGLAVSVSSLPWSFKKERACVHSFSVYLGIEPALKYSVIFKHACEDKGEKILLVLLGLPELQLRSKIDTLGAL